jgi:hypothetical protein
VTTKKRGKADDEDEDVDQDRCGLKALANSFIFGGGDDIEEGVHQTLGNDTLLRTLNLGLRKTFCDTAGAEALAAMIVVAKERFRCKIRADLRLNPVLEEAIVYALRGENDELLNDMSDHHLETMEILRRAKQRAALAARAMAARSRQEDVREAEWGSVGNVYDGDEDDFM